MTSMILRKEAALLYIGPQRVAIAIVLLKIHVVATFAGCHALQLSLAGPPYHSVIATFSYWSTHALTRPHITMLV